MSVKIIYESDDYIVVDKPYDMYINSDDKEEKVSINILSVICIYFLFKCSDRLTTPPVLFY